jgi:hypothetical protein
MTTQISEFIGSCLVLLLLCQPLNQAPFRASNVYDLITSTNPTVCSPLAEGACAASRYEPDLSLNLEICEMINKKQGNTYVKLLKRQRTKLPICVYR